MADLRFTGLSRPPVQFARMFHLFCRGPSGSQEGPKRPSGGLLAATPYGGPEEARTHGRTHARTPARTRACLPCGPLLFGACFVPACFAAVALLCAPLPLPFVVPSVMAPATIPHCLLPASRRAAVDACIQMRRLDLWARKRTRALRFEAVDAPAETRRRKRACKRVTRERDRRMSVKAGQRFKHKGATRAGSQRLAGSADRHIPALCCGRRPADCGCFRRGRGAEIAASVDREHLDTLIAGTRTSRIQTWRDTADMPQFSAQIGSMSLHRLFPVAFPWRHYSNPHF